MPNQYIMIKITSPDFQKLLLKAVLSILVIAATFDFASAQRLSYEALKSRDRVPTAYFDYNILPPASPGEDPQLIVSFKIGHDFLNFRTESGDDGDRRFYADAEIGVEIFGVEGRELSESEREELYTDRIRETQAARRAESRRDRRNKPERQSIGREFWNGTAYASTYEQTQSAHQHMEGYITRKLEPGEYEITARFSADQRTRNTLPRRIRIPDFENEVQTQVYFLDEIQNISIPATKPLINMGRNVFYGKDFNALFLLPEYDEQAEYRLRLKKLEVNRSDTTTTTVYDESLDVSDVYKGLDVRLTGDENDAVTLSMSGNESPYTYALKKIPNHRFENAHYRMEILQKKDNGESMVLGSRVFLNRWIDIPTSLLNVDVAINMMRFIVDDETLSELRSGNERQRERKFREFWSERNPTPETEYNELMVEYYRRIDYAFENYTTPRTPGYDSDMGKVYIQNGEPDNIIRRFPSNQPAVVVWEYNSRRFTFEATTGFGDYRLREAR